jgi:hypothetical protein
VVKRLKLHFFDHLELTTITSQLQDQLAKRHEKKITENNRKENNRLEKYFNSSEVQGRK